MHAFTKSASGKWKVENGKWKMENPMLPRATRAAEGTPGTSNTSSHRYVGAYVTVNATHDSIDKHGVAGRQIPHPSGHRG